MDAKKLVAVITLTITICISNPHAVKAGGPPPTKSGAGSLRGVVKFEGTVPKARLISMSADPNCARQHPSPVFAQEVVTDSKGDLENVVVYVAEGLVIARLMFPPSLLSLNRGPACTSRTCWRCGRTSHCMW